MIQWETSTMLITGGTGSFGRKFVEIMLAEYHSRKLIVYSRDEWKQHQMRHSEFAHPLMRYFISDIRDRDQHRRPLAEPPQTGDSL